MSRVDWDATQLSQAIHARQVSCEDVMGDYLAQIQRFNPSVNALVSLRDADEVLAEARACDRELDQGQSRGWMHGMPQAIKDLAATKGLRTTLGSPLFAEHVPAEDAISVSRVRA
ncbi:amidase, partial [Pseudomonas sp. PA-5-4G]